MDPNNYRRARSPPIGYHHPRPPIDEYDAPQSYPLVDRYDGPSHSQQLGSASMHPHSLPPQGQSSFMDVPHDYPPDYRDHPRMYPSHRITIAPRDPYTPVPINHQQRPTSPPYKILCITGINHKISDGPVKDALTSDFSRFGDISVTICHDSGERLAYIYFRSYEEAREARSSRLGTMLFDRQIEIEPIYEQDRSEPPVQPVNPVMMPNQSMYSPRRRSISPPPPNYPPDVKGSLAYRNAPVPSHRSHSSYGPRPNHPGYPYHRGTPPPEYIHPQPTTYPYGPPPPPSMGSVAPMAYDRRVNYDDGYNHYPSPHAVNTASPYSTPPHEHYRPSYPIQPSASSSQLHLSSRTERERISSGPNSPRADPYHHVEQRAPPPTEYPPQEFHSSRVPTFPQPEPGRRRRRSRGGRRSRLPPADPPMRFMSREYRREKFGAEHGPVEHEEGKPSRVLLVNNIDSSKTDEDLREIFESHGTIEDMEVKKVGPEISSAIVKFTSMDGAYKAKIANNGRFIGTTRCRIVYGKVSASRKLWIGGLSPSNTVASLEDECGRYGDIVSVEYAQGRPYCYVEFESANQAQFAAHHLKSSLTPAPERKIRVEFVDSERSERLVPRQETHSRPLETGGRSRAPTESSMELDDSPLSTNNTRKHKRALSPTLEEPKRVCQVSDLPFGSNTFKQERLAAAAAAAAAAKARSSSTTSSHPSEKIESSRHRDLSDHIEENNNGDLTQANNGNLDASETPTTYERMPQEAPSLESLSQCTSIRQLIDYCPVLWPGRLALKNLLFPAQLYLCSGSKELIDKYLSRPGETGEMQYPLLSITQRWRLHPQPKLEVVKRRMQSGNLGILIITSRQDNFKKSLDIKVSNEQRTPNVTDDPHLRNGASEKPVTEDSSEVKNSLDQTGSSVNSLSEVGPDGSTENAINNPASTPNRADFPSNTSPATQSKSIRNLISYLGQKDAAGVISLSASDGSSSGTPQSTDNPPKLLYTFPPGDFALNLLQRMAPKLTPESAKEEFLLGVISRGNLEGKI